jgi:hypothetical protein
MSRSYSKNILEKFHFTKVKFGNAIFMNIFTIKNN